MQTDTATTTISKTMMTRTRATKTAITGTCAARRGIITLGPNVPTIRIQKNTRAATTASVGTNEAEAGLGTMADGARDTATIIMMMEVDIAKDSAIIMAIGIPAENLAKAVDERCPAQRHGALIAPLGHPLSVLTKLGTPSVGVPDVQ